MRSTASSFVLLNPLQDYFQENLDLGFDPDWPFSASGHPLSTFEEQATLLEEFFPGSLSRSAIAKDSSTFSSKLSPHFLPKNHLFLKGKDSGVWSEVEAAFVRNYDRLKPQQLTKSQGIRLFPGISRKLFTELDTAEISGAILFPKTGVLDLGPYRNGIYEFLRENHSHQIHTLSGPIQFQNDCVIYNTVDGPETVVVRKNVVIFWSPAISSWFDKMTNQLELSRSPLPERQTLEEYRIVSKELIDSNTIGTHDHFSVWEDRSLLRVFRKARESAVFSEESFLDLKNWISGFLMWDYFKIRAMNTRSYSLPVNVHAKDRWEMERYSIEAYYSVDGNILRSLSIIQQWLKNEGIT